MHLLGVFRQYFFISEQENLFVAVNFDLKTTIFWKQYFIPHCHTWLDRCSISCRHSRTDSKNLTVITLSDIRLWDVDSTSSLGHWKNAANQYTISKGNKLL